MADENSVKCPGCYARVTPDDFHNQSGLCLDCAYKPEPKSKAPLALGLIWMAIGALLFLFPSNRQAISDAGGLGLQLGLALFFTGPGLRLVFRTLDDATDVE